MAIPLFLRDTAWLGSGLTLSLSVNLLSPALLGDKLRVVATTKAGGKRTATVQGEVRYHLTEPCVLPRKHILSTPLKFLTRLCSVLSSFGVLEVLLRRAYMSKWCRRKDQRVIFKL